MLLIVTASAPESLGASVAAIALADAIDEAGWRVSLASTDPSGAFARMFAERDRGVIATVQSRKGMRWIDDAPQVLRNADKTDRVLLCDYSGLGRLDLYRWPADTFRALIAPGVQTVFFFVSSTSDGANAWVARLMQDDDIASRAIIGIAPWATKSTMPQSPGSRQVSVPILENTAWAFLDHTSLPPKTAASWNGAGIGGLGRTRIKEWRDAWRRIAAPMLAFLHPLALPK